MNSKIAVAVGLVAVLAIMLVPVSLSPAFAENIAVSIVSGASSKTTDDFSPSSVNAKVGDTVTWTNNDIQAHKQTSGGNGISDNKFHSSRPHNLSPLK